MLECHIYPSEIAYCVLVGFVVRVIASRVNTPEYILWTSESRVLTGAPSGANQTRKKTRFIKRGCVLGFAVHSQSNFLDEIPG